jgi:hypothetical protein
VPSSSHRARILIGWEFGAGLGHVGMLRPLAEALQSQGHRVVLALRETVLTRKLLTSSKLEVIQGPAWFAPTDAPQVDLRTLADVFYASGLSDETRLRAHVGCWSELIRSIDPQLIIGEYSPGLAMAALGKHRYFTVGSGFTVLPPVSPAPPFRYWERQAPSQSADHEKAILETANAVRKALDLEAFSSLADLFGGSAVGVCTYPALDNYRAYRTAPALGPLSNTAARPCSLPCQREGVFAYLSGLASDFDVIVEGLAQASVCVHAHVRDLQPGQQERLRESNIALHEAPRDLHDELPRREAIVHHGGLSTTHVAIETGTPQLVLPNSTEQVITGQRLVDLKLGLGLSRPQRTPASVSNALQRVVGNDGYKVRAQAVRDQANQRKGPSALSLLIQECDALLSTI